MTPNEKLQELNSELEDLREAEFKLTKFIAELRAEQAAIKEVMDLSSAWRSGKGYEAFTEELEQYFQETSTKINQLQALIKDTQNSIIDIESRILLAVQELTSI